MRLRRRLALGAVRAHRRIGLGILLLSAALAVVIVSLGGFTAQYLAAVRSGAASSVGAPYQSAGGSEETLEALRTAAREHPEQWVGAVTSYGQIEGPGAQQVSAGFIREQSGPGLGGALVAGSAPQAVGDVGVTERMAREAGLGVDAPVTITTDTGSMPGRITAITRNDADTEDAAAWVVASPEAVLPRADTWLSAESPTTLSASAARDSSIGLLAETTPEATAHRAVADARARVLAAVLPLRVFLVLVTATAIAAMLLATLARLRPVIEGATAAGMGPRAARRTVGAGFIVLTVTGSAIGCGTGIALLSALRGFVAARLHQHWGAVAVPWASLGEVLLAVAAAVLVVAAAGRWKGRSRTALPIAAAGYPLLWGVLGAVGVAVSAALLWSRWAQLFLEGNVLGMLLASICLPLLMLSVPLLGRTRVQQRAIRPALRAVTVPLILSTMVVVLASFFSAGLVASTGSAGGEEKLGGYFDVQSASLSDIDALRRAHPAIMADAIVLPLASDAPQLQRAVSPQDAACLAAAVGQPSSQDCQPDVQTYIAFAPASGPGHELADTAQPEVLDARGSVQIASFTPATDAVEGMTTVDGIAADESSMLSADIMPGLVLSPDSPAAAAAGIVPSGNAQVHIPEFRRFSDEERDDFRRDVLTRVGYAFVSEPDSTEDLQLRTTAFTLAALAALAIAIVIALLTLVQLSLLAPLREALAVFDATPWQRARLLLPLAVAASVCVVGGCLVGIGGQAPSLRSLLEHGAEFSWYWTLPALVALIAVPLLLLVGSRPPKH